MPVSRKANTPARRRQWHDVENSAKARGASPKGAAMEAAAVVRDHPAKKNPKRR
jgi:hypothetical protein